MWRTVVPAGRQPFDRPYTRPECNRGAMAGIRLSLCRAEPDRQQTSVIFNQQPLTYMCDCPCLKARIPTSDVISVRGREVPLPASRMAGGSAHPVMVSPRRDLRAGTRTSTRSSCTSVRSRSSTAGFACCAAKSCPEFAAGSPNTDIDIRIAPNRKLSS